MYIAGIWTTPKELQNRIQKIYELNIRRWSDATQGSHPLLQRSKQKLFNNITLMPVTTSKQGSR